MVHPEGVNCLLNARRKRRYPYVKEQEIILCWDPHDPKPMTILSPQSRDDNNGFNDSNFIQNIPPEIFLPCKFHKQIDQLGKESAIAQRLKTPITSYNKLLQSEKIEGQLLYFVLALHPYHSNINSSKQLPPSHKTNEMGKNTNEWIDQGRNIRFKMSIRGYLKVGKRSLFFHNPYKNNQMEKIEHTPCVLDYFVRESYQRAGRGRMLFECMLCCNKFHLNHTKRTRTTAWDKKSENKNRDENVVLNERWRLKPTRFAYDRPSKKFVSFLIHHYGLKNCDVHFNNYAVFDGFWDD